MVTQLSFLDAGTSAGYGQKKIKMAALMVGGTLITPLWLQSYLL